MSPRKSKTTQSSPPANEDDDLQFPPEPIASQADTTTDLAPNEEQEQRQSVRAPDPFGILTLNAPENTLHLGKSDKARAYFIRFDKNPNAGRAEGDPHPVLKTLKEHGYAWRQSPGGGMAWKKPWEDGQYSHREEQAARGFARQVAEMLGAPQPGQSR